MTETESKVVEMWRKAADDLGFRFSSPFTIVTRSGQRIEAIGFIHHFGRSIGTIISVMNQPSSFVPFDKTLLDEGYYFSTLGGYGEYRRQLFVEILDDWQFFGSDSERPSWYTGKYWGQ
jgi:hypothetical protein